MSNYRRTVLYSVLCGVCVLAVWVLSLLALHTDTGQVLDEAISDSLVEDTNAGGRVLPLLLSATVPLGLVTFALAFVAAALLHRWSRLALAAVFAIGANVTVQLLKYVVLDRTTFPNGVDDPFNSFPSGHTTFAATAACALLLVVWRTRYATLTIVCGAIWSILVGFGTVPTAWHRPSDVIGAFLVVAAWMCAALALTTAFPRRFMTQHSPSPHGRNLDSVGS